ncbi:MAG: sulfatase-like hydrolase/transferase [Gemmatimonadetes bacterium]|jgi:choline-sulfatase|nr:sulfatase-like hydrolase/transferase [Gemmatimonadota bacterium]MBT6149236.1 sulfatase-like hydrolase/transferase [Gemmatimonadota bacterium]MBT7862691.1 sulfatase-like hydrolase/transferase [Gemmatimonadota bacterium]
MSNTPNVLVLISDQHSKHHLGCYGDELVRTPHLDRLASEGMRFDDAYTASPVCTPSRMAFMSCRRPSATQVWSNSHVLHSGTPTWAHALGAGGVDTALIGRMHFNGPDQRHGFAERPLGEYGAIHPGAPRQGAPLFSAVPQSTTGQSRVAVEIAGAGTTSYQALDEQVSEATCNWLRQRATGAQKPFAAVAGFLLPHCPFVAPKDLFDYYYDKVDIPEQPSAESQPPAVVNFRRNRGILEPLPEERVRVARAAYYGMCEHLDRQIGHILDCLDDTGLAEDTLVIYVSDHGEMAGEHGCWWKSNYYEGSVGVPMIARWPGEVAAGSASREICNLMDIGVTLADLADAPQLPQADGQSLAKTLRGESDPSRPGQTFSELGPAGGDAPSRMIRRDRWKLTKYGDDTPPMLFDLEADPGEWNDLGRDPTVAGVREDLLRTLCQDWDPAFVAAQSERLAADISLVSAWGRQYAEPTPDTLPIPEGVEDIDLR